MTQDRLTQIRPQLAAFLRDKYECHYKHAWPALELSQQDADAILGLAQVGYLLDLLTNAPDCEAAHGNNVNGRCPRCGAAVRVVGFQSCECGREQIEQLVVSAPKRVWLKDATTCANSMAECIAEGRIEAAIHRAEKFLESRALGGVSRALPEPTDD